jgi:hypothetical protein
MACLKRARKVPTSPETRRTAMLMIPPQTTLAFAPAPEDLEDIDFTAPIIALAPARDDEESEPGEP